MSRRNLLLVLGAAVLGGCTHGGGGSTGSVAPPVQGTSNHLVLSSGSGQIAADTAVATSSAPSTTSHFGIGGFDQSYTFTTPANAPLTFSLTAFDPSATGTVSLRIANADAGSSPIGGSTSPMLDLIFTGLRPSAGNLQIGNVWVETRGDGFAKVSITGNLAKGEVLFVEHEDSAGRKTHTLITIAIGVPGPINPAPSSAGIYAGIAATFPILSSDGPIFGLPAIAGNADRLTMVCYDSTAGAIGSGSGVGLVPAGAPVCFGGDFSRLQRHLQLDPATKAVTMGATAASGTDGTCWRDSEVGGLFNVVAIAQSGGDGVTLSFSFDRGATFPQVASLATGRLTRLPRIVIAANYTVGLVFWDTTGLGEQRLVLIEATPAAFDANNSPTSYTLGNPQVLVTLDATSPSLSGGVPLVPDVKYTTAGDTFVVYGFSSEDWTNAQEGFNTSTLRTHIGLAVRLAGGTSFTDSTVDDMTQVVPSDPSLSLLGTGSTTQVYVAYEGPSGVAMRLSADGGKTFPTFVNAGTPSAYSPRIFARTNASGPNTVDCVFLDQDAIGGDLMIFHSDAALQNATLATLVQAKTIPSTTKNAGPGTLTSIDVNGSSVEGMGNFGFDATELGGKLYVVAHTQQGCFYFRAVGVPFGGPLLGAANTLAPAAPPLVLYPGMTQTPPAFDSTATNKLQVLELN